MQINGSSVLVTGASGGLGQSVARELASRGGRLIVTGRRADVLEEIGRELDARVIAADLSQKGEVARLAAEVGDLDILVANAGVPAAGRLESFDEAEIARTVDVNLYSPIALTRVVLPGMLDRHRGHLVFMSSLAGKTTVPGNPLYHATKYGLRGFAAALRTDLHGSGVGVSCIFPGFIREAGIFAGTGVRLPPGIGTRSPEDVAKAVAGAIEHDRGEVDVAPFPQRAGVRVAGLAPDFSAALVRRSGGLRIAQEMDHALRDKR